MLLWLVTRKLEDGVEKEKLDLSCSLFITDVLVCAVLNGKGQLTLEGLCQGLQVLTTQGNWQASPV